MHLYFRVGLWVGAGTVAAGEEHPETPHAAASTVNSGISGSSTAVHWSSRRPGGRCRTSWSRRRWRYCWTAPATRFWLSARTASDAGQCLLRMYSGPLGTRHMWHYNHRNHPTGGTLQAPTPPRRFRAHAPRGVMPPLLCSCCHFS